MIFTNFYLLWNNRYSSVLMSVSEPCDIHLEYSFRQLICFVVLHVSILKVSNYFAQKSEHMVSRQRLQWSSWISSCRLLRQVCRTGSFDKTYVLCLELFGNAFAFLLKSKKIPKMHYQTSSCPLLCINKRLQYTCIWKCPQALSNNIKCSTLYTCLALWNWMYWFYIKERCYSWSLLEFVCKPPILRLLSLWFLNSLT